MMKYWADIIIVFGCILDKYWQKWESMNKNWANICQRLFKYCEKIVLKLMKYCVSIGHKILGHLKSLIILATKTPLILV